VLDAGARVQRLRADAKTAASEADAAAEAAKLAAAASFKSTMEGLAAQAAAVPVADSAGRVVGPARDALTQAFWTAVDHQRAVVAALGGTGPAGGAGSDGGPVSPLASAVVDFNRLVAALHSDVDAHNAQIREAAPASELVRVPWQLEYCFAEQGGPGGRQVVDFDAGRMLNANGISIFEDLCAMCRTSIQDGNLYGESGEGPGGGGGGGLECVCVGGGGCLSLPFLLLASIGPPPTLPHPPLSTTPGPSPPRVACSRGFRMPVAHAGHLPRAWLWALYGAGLAA
jgi:hypothetical protein